MLLSGICIKYKIDSSTINLIAEMMSKGMSLSEISDNFGSLNKNQVYLICSSYCKEEMGCPIDEVFPDIARERNLILIENTPKIEMEKIKKRAIKSLSKALDELDS